MKWLGAWRANLAPGVGSYHTYWQRINTLSDTQACARKNPTLTTNPAVGMGCSLVKAWSAHDDGRDGVDGGQEIGNELPVVATIRAGEKLAGIGANVNAAGVLHIGAESMP